MDFKFALRNLRRQPAMASIIVLTLALAIGANTAIFSLMDALLLQSLPVRDPQHLFLLQWSSGGRIFHSSSSYGDCKAGRGCSFSMPFYRELESKAHGLAAITASAGNGRYIVSGHGNASAAIALSVAGNYFAVLGLRPALGRLLMPSDDQPDAPVAMVVSYDYWQQAFAGSAQAVGQQIELNNVPATIVGVAPRGFHSLTPGRVLDGWLPLAASARLSPYWNAKDLTNADSIWLTLFARAGAGGAAAAQAEVSGLFRNAMLNGEKPLAKPSDNPRVALLPAQSALRGARGQFTQPLTILMWTVGFILLLACANVAGLLLGRARARDQEFAIRRALGAGGGRILRQLLAESLLLAGLGGVLGLALAWVSARALLQFMASGSYYGSLGLHVALDARVLGFTAAATIVTGLLFGLVPGLRGARASSFATLKQGGGNSVAHRHRWLHLGNTLVVAQIALCMVVLAGAGLLVRTLSNLRAVDPGFNPTHLLLFGLQPAQIGYKGEAVIQLYQRFQDQVAALPGVRSVSYSQSPLVSGNLSSTSYHIVPGGKEQDADVLGIGLNFFSTMGMPLRLGRAFQPTDFTPADDSRPRKPRPDSAPPIAAIVNEKFVTSYLGTGSPLGRVFGRGDNGAGKSGYVVVGVAGDAKYQDLRSAVVPTVYLPSSEGFASFEVRTAGDPMAMLPAIRGLLRGIDPNLPIFRPSTQEENIDQLLFNDRLLAGLASCFAGLALLLAAIGLYGLLAQEVTRRTREIGIRMALGAERRQVLRLVIGLGVGLCLAGLALGLAGAWGATRALKTMLFGVGTTDPVTLAAVGLLLFAVAIAACVIPARRATRVDPLIALRWE